MFKKLKIIYFVVTIIFSLMTIVGIVQILDAAGLIDLGGSNSAKSSSSGVVTDAEVKEVIAMSDEDVWKSLTGGLLTDRPADKSPSNASEIEVAVKKQIVDITVPIRAWDKASDESNMKIVKKEVTIPVNSLLSKLWQEFFEDLYQNAPDFVIAEVGGFRIDGIGDGQVGFKSGHTYGAAVDINASDNKYDGKLYSKSEWSKMSDSHKKHQIIYQDSDVVKIAHKYTLYWGGEWNQSKKDIMHFSFVCDGKTRAERIKMFGN